MSLFSSQVGFVQQQEKVVAPWSLAHDQYQLDASICHFWKTFLITTFNLTDQNIYKRQNENNRLAQTDAKK